MHHLVPGPDGPRHRDLDHIGGDAFQPPEVRCCSMRRCSTGSVQAGRRQAGPVVKQVGEEEGARRKSNEPAGGAPVVHGRWAHAHRLKILRAHQSVLP